MMELDKGNTIDNIVESKEEERSPLSSNNSGGPSSFLGFNNKSIESNTVLLEQLAEIMLSIIFDQIAHEKENSNILPPRIPRSGGVVSNEATGKSL